MKKNYNIPILKIPKTASKNELKIFSYNFIYFIKKYSKYIEEEINTEMIIAKENNYYNDYYFNGFYNCYNFMIYELYTMINEKSFWKGLLSEYTCDYIYQNGKKYNQICGRSIEIKCTNIDGKYRCHKHISKKIYKSSTKNISKNNLCTYNNNKGKPCGKNKYINGYCIYHYKHSYEQNKDKYRDYIDINKELELFNNIEYNTHFEELFDNSVQNVLNGSRKKESDILLNKLFLKRKVDDIIPDKIKKIKKDTRLCTSYKCYNFKVTNKDYCEKCLRIILDENNLINNNSEFITSLEANNYFLNYKFSFKYPITDYYIININKNNKKLLNKILIYIIEIRNCIYNEYNYIYNKLCLNILHISEKILKII